MEKTVHNSDLNHQRHWTVQIWIMKSIFHLFSSTEQGLELVSLFYDFQFARPWIVVFVTILILGKLLLVFFFWVVFVTADLSNFMSPWVCGFSCLWSCLIASVFLFLRKKDITFSLFLLLDLMSLNSGKTESNLSIRKGFVCTVRISKAI